MTLVAAWIRQPGTRRQLVVASDSRLSFGARWDCCPKIFPMSRNDSVLAFCGDTAFAYPIILQMINAVRNYEKVQSREMDITDLRPHFIKIIESMRGQVTDFPRPPHGIDPTDFKLLFAGYSTKLMSFRAWTLYFDQSKKAFNHKAISFHKKRTGGTKPFLFAGDETIEAETRLYELLKSRSKLTTGGLDMEPLEVLTGMCEAAQFATIGGPPQIVKVYSFANVLPINVLWPREDPEYISHFGRPLLPYEGTKYACIDLNDLSLLAPSDAYKRLPSSLHEDVE